MAHAFGSRPQVIPEFTGLQVNTSVQVLPIPIIYGSPRVQVNVIYYNGFNSQLVSQSRGGKGVLGGGKGGGSQQVEYFATFIAAIGEGPLGAIQIIYQDSEVWTPGTYPTNGASYFNGTSTQAPWSYVVDNWPNDARPYKDTAYYAFANAQIDSSATIPQINLVVAGYGTSSSPLNNSTLTISTGQYDPNGNPLSYIGDIVLGDADADPASVIIDFLTNSNYGATFPTDWIDYTSLYTSTNVYDPSTGDQALSTYCQAVGLAWSLAINNVESANSLLERWCKNLGVAVVWNGAQLKFVPYWDTFVGTNPGYDPTSVIAMKYFNPYTLPIVTITMDFILQSKSKDQDPITFSRKDPLEVYNTVRLNYKDRTNFFNDNTVEAKDEVHIEEFGPRVDNVGLATEFSLTTYANVSAQIQLQRNLAIMRTFTWKMGPLWGWLDPMDIVQIPDPTNYNNTILVRITSVEDDEEENVVLSAEEFPVGSQSIVAIPTSPTTPPNMGATNSPPSSIYPPVMFEPTTAMLTATGFSTPQWIFGCSAGANNQLDTNWGGVNIWVSQDQVNYQMLGTLQQPSLIGSLTTPLPAYGGSNPDTTDTIYVNLSECDGVLPSYTTTTAANGSSLCVISDLSGFELVSYTTALLIGPNTYALTGLYRGLYGTSARSFGGGSQFMFVGTGANIFEIALPQSYVGEQLWVKAQSFNVFNTATQDLSDCVAYPYTVVGPTPAGLLPPPSIMNPSYRPQVGNSISGPNVSTYNRNLLL